MREYTFSHIERFALWKTYSYRCFHCGQTLKWKDLTIDHLFPKYLLHYPRDFGMIKQQYRLKTDFCINDFDNWVPAHGTCNNRKADKILACTRHFVKKLEKADKLSHVARNMYRNLLRQRAKDKTVAKILTKLEDASITTSDLYCLMERTTAFYFGIPNIEPEDIAHVPNGWKVMNINKKQKFLKVTDGKRTGIVPQSISPNDTWLCPSCKCYGPWDDDLCLGCGKMYYP